MEPGDIREVSYELACQVRGLYRLGPLRLSKEDPYGLATTTSLVPGHTDLLILPRVESLGSGRPGASGVGAGSSYSPLLASPDEDDVAVRSFRDGDDLRRIHWPSTAHRSRLMVRQEDHPARRRAVIVVDSREAGHQGSGLTGSFEWSVTAAASIAVHLAEHQYLVHLASGEAAVNGQMRQTVEIDDAVALLALAQLGPSQQYEEVLRSAGQLTPGALVVAIVTDHDEKALRRTAALRPPEGTGLLILLDTASFARPPGAAPTGQTLALAAMFASAGWSTCVVGAGMPVAQAWSIVSSRNPVIDRAAAR
jgi:uncharacterized protein (DUF58 family)